MKEEGKTSKTYLMIHPVPPIVWEIQAVEYCETYKSVRSLNFSTAQSAGFSGLQLMEHLYRKLWARAREYGLPKAGHCVIKSRDMSG